MWERAIVIEGGFEGKLAAKRSVYVFSASQPATANTWHSKLSEEPAKVVIATAPN